MPRSLFPYPGGKYNLANWIISNIPVHECYVEPFGGSAGVLLSKSASKVEVFNDIDEDVVQFFRTVREREDELVNWLRRVPYSRTLHDEWVSEYYDGYRPEDPIERAGRFFYLRHSQFASKYDDVSGWSSSRVRNEATKFRDGSEELLALTERLRAVQIEHRDFAQLLSEYDGEDSFFYLDPPYVAPHHDPYNYDTPFDREQLAETLEDMDGKWMVSLAAAISPSLGTDPSSEELIEAAEDREDDPLYVTEALRDGRHLVWRDTSYSMRRGVDEWEKSRVECLLLNYDPVTTPMFVDATQTALKSFGTADD